MPVFIRRTVERLDPDVARPPRQRLWVGLGTSDDGAIKVSHTIFILEDRDAAELGLRMGDFPLHPVPVRIRIEAVGAGD